MPATLHELRTQAYDDAVAARTAWRARLQAAQKQLQMPAAGDPDTAASAAKKAVDAVAVLDAAIDAARQALEKATAPVELNALSATIATKSLERREAVWASLAAQAALADVKVEAAGAEARVRGLEETVEAAQRAKEAADDDEERLDGARTRLAGDLAGVPADANALVGAATFADAEAHFAAARMPGKLRAVAEKRYERERARMDHAAQAVRAAEDARAERLNAAGPAGVAEAKALDHARARAALLDFDARAAGHLANATAILTKLAKTKDEAPALSDEVVAALTEAGALGDRNDAADLAVAYEAAEMAREAAQAARDAAAAKVRLDQPLAPEATIDADVTVQLLADTLSDRVDDANAAGAAYTPADRARMLAWQAEVPAAAWAALRRFLDARETLNTLRTASIVAGDAGSLPASLADAEQAYADALEASAAAQAALDEGDRRTAEAAAELEGDQSQGRARLMSALTGNGR